MSAILPIAALAIISVCLFAGIAVNHVLSVQEEARRQK